MKATIELPNDINIIGAGGVGSWVIPALARLTKHAVLHVWDGDTLEQKNLDRQLFKEDHIGENKARAIGMLYPDSLINPCDEYFHEGSEIADDCLILCCADNHAARRAALFKADETTSTCIIAGNEYTDADAYIYKPRMMRGTPNDPRVFAPEILTDNSGDPRRPDGCQGAAQIANPQLVLANMAAADHMLRLMWWWFAETSGLKRDTMAYWPVMHRTTASRSFTVLYKDRLAERKEAV